MSENRPPGSRNPLKNYSSGGDEMKGIETERTGRGGAAARAIGITIQRTLIIFYMLC